MEWQPSNPEGERVILTDLGSLYFDKLAEDPALKNAVQTLNASIQPQIISLQVRAFVWKAVTVESDQQSIFIIATDQSGQPLDNAACTATIHWPNEAAQAISATTNRSGIGTIRLSFMSKPSGSLIPIDVNCQYENNWNGSTTTAFRIWY